MSTVVSRQTVVVRNPYYTAISRSCEFSSSWLYILRVTRRVAIILAFIRNQDWTKLFPGKSGSRAIVAFRAPGYRLLQQEIMGMGRRKCFTVRMFCAAGCWARR